MCAAGFVAFVWQHRQGRSQLRRKKIDLCEEKRGEARGRGTSSSSHSPVFVNRILNQWTARAFPGVSRWLLLVASAQHKIYVYEKGKEWRRLSLEKVIFVRCVFHALSPALCRSALHVAVITIFH